MSLVYVYQNSNKYADAIATAGVIEKIEDVDSGKTISNAVIVIAANCDEQMEAALGVNNPVINLLEEIAEMKSGITMAMGALQEGLEEEAMSMIRAMYLDHCTPKGGQS